MGGLWRNSEHKASSSFTRLWKRSNNGGSNKVLPAKLHHEKDKDDIVAEPSSSSQVTAPSSVPKTTTTLVGPAILSEFCEANNLTPKDDGATTLGPQSLWDLAYDALRKEKPEVVEAYEELLFKVLPYMANTSSATDLENLLSKPPTDLANTSPTSDTEAQRHVAHNLITRRKMMDDIIGLGQEHMDNKKIAFKVGQQEFVLQDQMQYVVAGIQVGRDWISEAVQASPLASAAWAGVSLLLPLLTNPAEVQAVNEEGLGYVTQKIRYYTAMESPFLFQQDETVKREYEDRLVELYQAIIDFQAQSVMRFFRRRFSNWVRDTVKWDSWEEMLKKIKELGGNLETESLQISALLNTRALDVLASWARDSGEEKCLQSLRAGCGDYPWFKDRVEARVPDTCHWLLNHTSYQAWLEADSGPLLVSADPGCGKSVLSKYLIDSRFEFNVPQEAAICYFFFKEGDQNTITQAFCALIHQLLCLRPKLMPHALQRYRQHGAKLREDVTALWNILEAATADPEAGSIVIVLDALDESVQDERNMATLSRYIRTHFEQGPKHLKILMTSRPYQNTIQHIQELEKSFPNIRINGEDESETILQEINLVIEDRVSRMSKFKADLKAHLKQRLLAITHRTYLWIYLVFSHLENTLMKSTTQRLDKAIQNLPTSVGDAYEKILDRSPEPKETRKALLILLAANRPLTLREMQVMLGLSIETTPEKLESESDEDFKLYLRELCGLFITVHNEKVYFLHQTVREFLLPLSIPPPNPTTTTGWAHTFTLNQAHMILAESCTVYLNSLNSSNDVNPNADIFEYSARNWDYHFREAGYIPDGTAIVSLAEGICDPESQSFSAWFTISTYDATFGHDDHPTSLTIASTLGLEAVVRLLLGRDNVSVDWEAQASRISLLHAASWGHEGVAKLLLNTNKVDINSANSRGATPLIMAALERHTAIVQFLLNTNKADMNLANSEGATPLILAA
ncbi:hypothetical protein F4824DRAFT_465195 [Ustulina deusta]|nr:hypothetical protein F4824DRAFT_465195 [Ustulina deusta]